MFAPSVADDVEMQEWWARVMRLGASPGAAVVIERMVAAIDVRDVLPSIRVRRSSLPASALRGEAEYMRSGSRTPGAWRSAGSDALFWEADGSLKRSCSFAEGLWGAAGA